MISLTLAILLIGSSYEQGQPEVVKDFKQAHTLAEVSEHTTLQHAVIQALQDTGISGGVATVESGCTAKSTDFYAPKGMFLSDAIDSLVAKDGQHTWQFSNGLVVVLPKAGLPQLLRTKITHVHISDTSNLILAVDELMQANEVREAFARVNAFARSPEVGFQKLNTSRSQVAKQPTDLADVSLVEALNALAVGRMNAVWFYQENTCNGRTSIRLDFASK